MTVLLLDDRWPTLIPVDAVDALYAPLTFTDEVSIAVRWNITQLAKEDVLGVGTLVSTRSRHPEVIRRIQLGEVVYEVHSRRDPVELARRVMHQALNIGEWESTQTHESLLPYLQEEAEEFAEAVRSGAGDEELRKELADVYLQVLFHAEIASRRGAFDMGAVARAFVDKLRVRAPYLFDGTTTPVDTKTQEQLWAKGKEIERATSD